ncbi:hypothetical protein Fcan01_16990 [Folsomia candida]|uniref:Uncharacterized protein n=1 Tax=Folsomia candida TaxID=158441 RepID=A0A226DS45_FOLCA|nr:hypothetical protein Fcan01_16990 [Folsomia candida]
MSLTERIKIEENTLLASKMYHQLELFNQFLNQEFLSNSMPPVIFFGSGSIFLTLLPETANVNEKSVEYLATARHKVVTKYEKRVIYSFKPVGIRCGGFCVVSASWATKLMEAGLNYTATLLLTF